MLWDLHEAHQLSWICWDMHYYLMSYYAVWLFTQLTTLNEKTSAIKAAHESQISHESVEIKSSPGQSYTLQPHCRVPPPAVLLRPELGQRPIALKSIVSPHTKTDEACMSAAHWPPTPRLPSAGPRKQNGMGCCIVKLGQFSHNKLGESEPVLQKKKNTCGSNQSSFCI